MPDTPTRDTDPASIGMPLLARHANAVGLNTEMLRLGIMDARARVFFRIVALCLSALVLFVITLALHVSAQTFFDVIRQTAAVNESLRAMPIDVALTVGDPLASMPELPNWPHAAVAVFTALLVGDVVLAIGLIRATFGLSVHTGQAAAPSKHASAEGLALPGAELLKATKDAIATVTKGVSPR